MYDWTQINPRFIGRLHLNFDDFPSTLRFCYLFLRFFLHFFLQHSNEGATFIVVLGMQSFLLHPAIELILPGEKFQSLNSEAPWISLIRAVIIWLLGEAELSIQSIHKMCFAIKTAFWGRGGWKFGSVEFFPRLLFISQNNWEIYEKIDSGSLFP